MVSGTLLALLAKPVGQIKLGMQVWKNANVKEKTSLMVQVNVLHALNRYFGMSKTKYA
jgi:hypothetical protein